MRRSPRKLEHRLRALRAECGLTLKQLSQATGLAVSTLHSIEKQERQATLATAFKLAHYYGLTVANIWQPLFRQICGQAPGAGCKESCSVRRPIP